MARSQRTPLNCIVSNKKFNVTWKSNKNKVYASWETPNKKQPAIITNSIAKYEVEIFN